MINLGWTEVFNLTIWSNPKWMETSLQFGNCNLVNFLFSWHIGQKAHSLRVCKRGHVNRRPCSSGKELCPSCQEKQERSRLHLIVQKLITSNDYLHYFLLPPPDFWLLYLLALAPEYWKKRKKEMKRHVILLLLRCSIKRIQKNIIESKGIETTG